jgi:hypothetical protein
MSTLTAAVTAVAALLVASCGGTPASDTSPEPAPTTPAPVPSGGGLWRPAPGVSWQWQLSGPVDVSVDADVYDVDLFDVDESTVRALHERGRRVICYVSAGSNEEWRPDAGRFPDEVLCPRTGPLGFSSMQKRPELDAWRHPCPDST